MHAAGGALSRHRRQAHYTQTHTAHFPAAHHSHNLHSSLECGIRLAGIQPLLGGGAQRAAGRVQRCPLGGGRCQLLVRALALLAQDQAAGRGKAEASM